MKHSIRAVFGMHIALSLTLLLALSSPVLADANDDALKAMIATKAAIKAGRAKAQICTRCHGRNGIHQLAVKAGWKDSDGQFVMTKLRALRDGKEAHQVMSAVAKGLKDNDIVQIALWLDSLAAKR